MLQIEANNNKRMSARKKLQENGVIPELQDTRSTWEKLNDKQEMLKQFRLKVYKLFRNDTNNSEGFINLVHLHKVDYSDFNIVYKQLYDTYGHTLIDYRQVFDTMQLLIQNIQSTGTVAGSVGGGRSIGGRSMAGSVWQQNNPDDPPDDEEEDPDDPKVQWKRHQNRDRGNEEDDPNEDEDDNDDDDDPDAEVEIIDLSILEDTISNEQQSGNISAEDAQHYNSTLFTTANLVNQLFDQREAGVNITEDKNMNAFTNSIRPIYHELVQLVTQKDNMSDEERTNSLFHLLGAIQLQGLNFSKGQPVTAKSLRGQPSGVNAGKKYEKKEKVAFKEKELTQGEKIKTEMGIYGGQEWDAMTKKAKKETANMLIDEGYTINLSSKSWATTAKAKYQVYCYDTTVFAPEETEEQIQQDLFDADEGDY